MRSATLLVILLALGCASGMEAPSNSPFGVVGGAPALGSSGQGAAAGSGGTTAQNPMNPPSNRPITGPDAPPNNMPKAGSGGAGGSGGGSGGSGAAGSGPTGMAGSGPTGMAGNAAPVGEPVIPMVTGECPTFRNGTINFGGLGGIAVQAGAKAAGPTAPMVFYWHGTGSLSSEYGGMAAAVHRGVMAEGGVLISFQGTTGGDLLSGTAIFGAGDFELADQLVACAVQNHNVDPKRIFATGCSAGGLFSGAMGAMRSNYMAAVAPNSGGLTAPVRWQNGWTPALMTVHGAAGVDVVIVDFSRTSMTADTAYKGRGGFVINCDHGGFHCGGGGLAPDIWEFFKAHPYGTKPSPWASALPSGFNSDCKIM